MREGIESCVPRTRRTFLKIAQHFLYCSEQQAPFHRSVAFSFVSINQLKPSRFPFPINAISCTCCISLRAVSQKQFCLTIKGNYSRQEMVLEIAGWLAFGVNSHAEAQRAQCLDFVRVVRITRYALRTRRKKTLTFLFPDGTCPSSHRGSWHNHGCLTRTGVSAVTLFQVQFFLTVTHQLVSLSTSPERHKYLVFSFKL